MANFIVEAEVRTGSGTAASRRSRREGKVPVVVYGGGEDEQYLLVDHNKMIHQLDVEAFHSALVQLHVGDDLQRAILRDVQMHPFKQQIMHLDFQRVSRKDTISMTVPLHFKGEEDAPGVKTDSGIMTHNMTSVDITCLGSDLPEYVEVDVSGLGLGESVHLGEITLPAGVQFAPTVQEADLELPVAAVLAPKKPQSEEDEDADVAGEDAVDAAKGDSEE
ncbi:50S ribosomal protein L25/general stress protein Ctc [Arenicella xantha]|uniref:Large ribosomal subunit protein bL25 n=1 Tax=Arenicella xantha TaxID=644221 RepID=A0A395JQ68_9GAMM|nr:50S ribosomal protein L25/general stress protein Ctc [Arenicella xantha]RBP52765.1 large subunit ribosomal protein L25 [Arenicella xantha]